MKNSLKYLSECSSGSYRFIYINCHFGNTVSDYSCSYCSFVASNLTIPKHSTTHTHCLPSYKLGYKTQALASVSGADKGFLFPLSVPSLLWSPCINHPLMRLQLMIPLLIKHQTWGTKTINSRKEDNTEIEKIKLK